MAILLRDLYRYSDNCRKLLRETLEANPQAFDTRFPTTGQYDTVRMLLAHSVGAEERWIERRIRGGAVIDYEGRAGSTIVGLFGDWDGIRERTYGLMDGLGPGGLERIIDVELGSGAGTSSWRGQLTIEQILFHIVNHEVHHRAQVSMALQQMGIDPPNFDYVLLHG